MGFYAPAQIVRDAREHGVEVRPVCVNASRWDCTLEAAGEDRFAVRLGMRLVRGLANADAARIIAARADKPFTGVDDLWRRAEVPVASLVRLAEADAFQPALGLARREALWAIKALRDAPLPLFAAAAARAAGTVPEIQEPAVDAAADDRRRRGGRGLRPCRPDAARPSRRVPARRSPAAGASSLASRRCGPGTAAGCTTAGLVLVRQMPGSAKGVMFVTIEDETGIANLIVWPSVFEQPTGA